MPVFGLMRTSDSPRYLAPICAYLSRVIRFRKGQQLGRWDIEHQLPMDELVVTNRLAQALMEAGYMVPEEE